MATLNIGGTRVKVDDAFLTMSPEQQKAAVEEIAKSLPDAAQREVRPATHPEFDPANVPGGVPGYDPGTGLVDRKAAAAARPVSGVTSAVRGAADTASFGFGDEMAAAGISGIEKLRGNDTSYGDVLSDIRGMQQGGREQNPKSYMTGQIVGALLQGLATRGAGFMPNATSLGGKVAGGMLTGGTAGALYGFGSGEDTASNRIIDALISGGTGAAVGGAIPLLAEGAKAGYRAIIDHWVNKPVAKQAGASLPALRTIGEVVDADGTLGPMGQANMARAGHDAMLADAGPTARQALDTSIQRTGPGAVLARERIDDRVARGSQAMVDALDTTLGKPQGVETARAAIRSNSAAARSSAYDDAYKTAIDYADPRGQALENMVRGRVPSSVIERANALMRLNGDQSRQILAKIADDGTVAFETMPDVRQLDYITRALNDLAKSGDGQGAMGGQTALGSAYQNLSREMRDTLRDLVPEYGNALETAADPIRRSQAVQFGAELLNPTTTPEQVAEFTKGMTQAERSALAQGLRSQVANAMGNVTRTISDDDVGARAAMKVIKDLSSSGMREKLALAIGEDQADKLLAEADRIATTFNLRADLTANSKTYARQAMERRISDAAAPGAIDRAISGEPLKATQRALQAITGNTPEAIRRREDVMYREVADLLTRPQAQAQGIFNAIGKVKANDARADAVTDQIIKALTGQKLTYPATVAIDQQRRR